MVIATTIGQAARRSGLSPKAIRLYETKGLLETADRTPSGYRTYTDEDVSVLRFIRQAKSLDLRLDEIREVIDLQRGGAQPCRTVLGLLDRHIADIDRTMANLRTLRATLARARSSAKSSTENGNEGIICQIVESQT
ncbi:MAG TPA: MerR family transcriptional regulator [Candidatus Acidoferrales bacterium]|nr:MerR family transcriptional regulator [Candidatus Acidoferrales bacterium]